MTQLKLQDFFQDIETSVLAQQSDIEDKNKNMEDERTKTETNISFHSFKVKKSMDKEDLTMSLFGGQETKGLYSRYSIVSGDRSNTFTAGLASKGIKSTGKETVSKLGKYGLKDIPFTGFGGILANQKQDNIWNQVHGKQMKSDPTRD